MPYFKTTNNSLHFLEAGVNPALVQGFPSDAQAISDEEAAQIQADALAAAEAAAQATPAPTPEQKLAAFLSANPDVLQLVGGA